MVDKADRGFDEVGLTGTRAGFDDCGARARRDPIEDGLLFGGAVGNERGERRGGCGEGEFHTETVLMRSLTEDSRE